MWVSQATFSIQHKTHTEKKPEASLSNMSNLENAKKYGLIFSKYDIGTITKTKLRDPFKYTQNNKVGKKKKRIDSERTYIKVNYDTELKKVYCNEI